MERLLEEALKHKDVAALHDIVNEDCVLKRPGSSLVHGRDRVIGHLLEARDVSGWRPYLSYTIVDTSLDDVPHQMKIRTSGGGVSSVYIDVLDRRRIRLDIAYDGSAFYGFQRQKKGRTVQKTFEDALEKLFARTMEVHGASRTDRGVHALHQVLHFDTDNALDTQSVKDLMNRVLPDDIVVHRAEDVPVVFHARYDALRKTYRYRITHEKDPFLSRHATFMPAFDVDLAESILKRFEGTHDFTLFTKTPVPENARRTIHATTIEREASQTTITVTGDGFLRHMVRFILGAVLEDVRKSRENADLALQGISPGSPFKPVPSRGLSLMSIDYR